MPRLPSLLTRLLPGIRTLLSAAVALTATMFAGFGHLLAACPRPQGPCATSQVRLDTGYDHLNATVLPLGAIDARWTVVQDPTTNTLEPRPATVIDKHSAWATPEPGSQWISGYPTSAQSLNGTYVFETTFCLRPTADLSQCILDIGMRGDDASTAFLNGTMIHTGQGFNVATLTVGSYPLTTLGVIGTNTLRVEVQNTGGGAMGLNLVATVTAPNGSADKPECCGGAGALQGVKYNDLDGDGQRDIGEPTLPGWQINLWFGSTLVNSVTTDSTGSYSFTNVQPGTYAITETQQAGWTQTAPSSGSHTVTLQALQGINNLDFGNQVLCTAAPSIMVGWWDGWSGATVPDRAGSILQDGTWMGGVPLATTGYVGDGTFDEGLRHDGTHWVDVPDHPQLNFGAGANFTIDLWVKPAFGATVGLQPLVCKTWNGLSPNHEIGYAFYLEDGHPALLLGDGGFTGTWGLYSYVATGINVPANQWTFLAVTVARGSTPLITFYANGSPMATFTPITTSVSHKPLLDMGMPPVNLRIGAFSPSFVTMLGGTFGPGAMSSAIFNGETDEVELFRTELKATDIARIFNAGTKGKCKDTPYSWDPYDWRDIAFLGSLTDTAYPFHLPWPFMVGPMAYSDLHVSTNGFAYLSNGPASPGSATGFGPASTMVANLRNGPMRIAPFWADLDLQAAGGGVYVAELTNPDRVVVTWKNAVEVGHSTPKTFQCQILRTGEILFAYDGAITAEGTNVLVGVSVGGGIADPGTSDFSLGAFGSSTIAYENFNSGQPFDLGSHLLSWLPNGPGFDVLPEEIVNEQQVVYGTGCYQRRASFYQHFDTALAAAQLQGQSMALVPLSDGYVVTWGGGGFVAPSGGATTLAVGDDGQQMVTPGIPLPTPFGMEFAFHVHANGVVSMGATPQTFPGLLPDWAPNSAGFLGAANTAFWCWHDFNPSEPGSGAVKYEEIGTTAYITWDDVESRASPETTNRSTVQCQLDLATGVVTWVWPHIDTNSSGSRGSGYLVGFSPGGLSLDPGEVELATGLPLTTAPDDGGLVVTASSSPIPGSLVAYTTANMPEFVPGSGMYVGITMISFTQIPGGFDLAPFGAPGCPLLLGSFDFLFSQLGTTPLQSTTLAIPASTPAGLQFFVQAAALASFANPMGIVTSNGIASTVP